MTDLPSGTRHYGVFVGERLCGSDSSVSLKVDPLLLRVSDKSVGERGGTRLVALQTLVGTEGLAAAVTGGNSKCRVA